MPYHHGIKVTEINTGARVIAAASTAIIGIVATATDADVAMFPLNRPVLVTDLRAAIAKAGVIGTLAKALSAIADQASPIIVVVRVEIGANAAATTANVIGTAVAGSWTGMQALLAAQVQLGVRPRILGCPGLDNQAVTTALSIVADKLGAMVYASCDTSATVAEALTFRANFANRNTVLIWPNFTAFDVVSQTVGGGQAIARALGLRARIDQDTGWHKTLSNVAVAGVTGLSKDVHWDLQATDTEADILNAAGVVTLVHAGTGFRYWGDRTCSDEPLFSFESAARTAMILKDMIADSLLWAMDKPLHPSLARDIIETINAQFRGLKTQGYIIDGKARIDAASNPQSALAGGKLTIDYDYTPVPPLEQLALNQRITDSYLADFASRV